MIEKKDKTEYLAITMLVIFAGILRVILACKSTGFAVDLQCFGAWGMRMAELGPANFYAADYFCDYPPGFIWILGFLGLVAKWLKISLLEPTGYCMIRLLVIPFDLLLTWLVYHIARQSCDFKMALALAAGIACNPVYLIAGVCWGQFDALLSVFVVCILYFASQKRWDMAVLFFAIAVLMKPQAGLLLIIAIAAIGMELFFVRKKENLFKMLFGIVYACVAALVIVLPFSVHQTFPIWLYEKYAETLSSYQYASLSTGNLMFLLGGNWVDTSEYVFGSVTYAALGTALMIVCFLAGALVYCLGKTKASVILAGALTYQALYFCSTKIHERYIIPAFALLLLAYAKSKDLKLLISFVLSSLASAVNIWIVLQYDYLYGENEWMGYPIAIVQSIALILTIWSSVQMITKKEQKQ